MKAAFSDDTDQVVADICLKCNESFELVYMRSVRNWGRDDINVRCSNVKANKGRDVFKQVIIV